MIFSSLTLLLHKVGRSKQTLAATRSWASKGTWWLELDRKGLSLWSAQSPDTGIVFKGKQIKGHMSTVPSWRPSKEASAWGQRGGENLCKGKTKQRVRNGQWWTLGQLFWGVSEIIHAITYQNFCILAKSAIFLIINIWLQSAWDWLILSLEQNKFFLKILFIYF